MNPTVLKASLKIQRRKAAQVGSNTINTHVIVFPLDPSQSHSANGKGDNPRQSLKSLCSFGILTSSSSSPDLNNQHSDIKNGRLWKFRTIKRMWNLEL